MSLTQLFLSETNKPNFYIKERYIPIPVKIKENKGSWWIYGTLDNKVKERIELRKPNGATHFWAFQVTSNEGNPLYSIVQYFTIN